MKFDIQAGPGNTNSKRTILQKLIRISARSCLLLFPFLFASPGLGQNPKSDTTKIISDTAGQGKFDPWTNMKYQRDLIDIGYLLIRKNPEVRLDTTNKQTLRLHISGAPTPEYSLATGFAANITANIAFYSRRDGQTNISSILLSPTYTQKKQLILPIQSSIWTPGNKYNIAGDWRFLSYPEATYGLGGYKTKLDATQLNYYYIRFYQFVMRELTRNLYGGVGYQLDNHWNIQELDLPPGTVTDFDQYGFTKSSVSSGLSFNLLYDSRKNSINPEGGIYGNLVFRQNLSILGSDQNWESLLIDLRKYIRISESSHNILAFWSYNWLTLNGKPPYLDLPSTGWDTYSNTGRGYVQSRFRSKNMIDFEAEYRFGILNNGLLGGVVFGNLQSYSEISNNRFEVIEPAAGAGLRIKFNKFSRTNICIDYAVGKNGSGGIFTNLGEVF
jgi:hypothetical protein